MTTISAIIGQHIDTPPVVPTWRNGSRPRPFEATCYALACQSPSEAPGSAQDAYVALYAIDLTTRCETVECDSTTLDSLAGGVCVGRRSEWTSSTVRWRMC
ncbi:MAG: hypothetical protein O3C10_10675 [Chloroflexi bacterium]|nr:hypothetical protein [Chloroflexota bacterium]